MAWQSPHVQRASAFESHRDTAADRRVAGLLLRLDQLLAAAAGDVGGCGAHRANGGPWHQHLVKATNRSNQAKPIQTYKPALRVVQCVTQVFLSCFCCWTSCEVMLATGAKHNMSETFSVGQQLTFEGFLAIVLRCLQSTSIYKMISGEFM